MDHVGAPSPALRVPEGLGLPLSFFLLSGHALLPTQSLVDVVQEKADALVVVRVQFQHPCEDPAGFIYPPQPLSAWVTSCTKEG